MDSLEEKLRSITNRDIVNNLCLSGIASCKVDEIVFDPAALNPIQDQTISSFKEESNTLGHRSSIEQAHQTIEVWASEIKEEYFRRADFRGAASEKKAIIKSYTTKQLQRLLTLVPPEELSTMSSAERDICETYLNLRAAPGVNDSMLRTRDPTHFLFINAIYSLFPQIYNHDDRQMVKFSLHELYWSLRRKIDDQPEAKKEEVVKMGSDISMRYKRQAEWCRRL
ncbi:MAG: hypothetical protein Q9211_000598 [Gyalolechia sp. 1 TL-2023]